MRKLTSLMQKTSKNCRIVCPAQFSSKSEPCGKHNEPKLLVGFGATCRAWPTMGTVVLMAFGILIGAGCGIGKPAGASFASVIIKGKTPEEICQTTAAVFQEDGFQVGVVMPSNMVFQKEGSRGQSLAYGGVVDTTYGSTTMVRVKASLVDLGASGQRLQCQAYMVRNANDSFFEDESRLLNIHGGKYQGLLNKVAKRLK
jgi:hypothetical protein